MLYLYGIFDHSTLVFYIRLFFHVFGEMESKIHGVWVGFRGLGLFPKKTDWGGDVCVWLT